MSQSSLAHYTYVLVQSGIILMRVSACLQFVLLMYAGSWTTKEGFWQVLCLRLCHSSTYQAQDSLNNPSI